jgi:tRNA (adenine57-N1/adenine58-N1)-methyltransferase
MEPPFSEGDLALIVDPRGREYLQTLGREKVFQSHMGHLAHDAIIGCSSGSRLDTHTGHQLIVLRPTLVQYVMNMKRTSQIIYPKDVGPILVYGDIYPGATVVEAGIGSGALTLALLRAVGDSGRVTTYEVREDLAKMGVRNVEGFMPGVTNFELRAGDIYEGIKEREVDRVVLDLPEPWRAIGPATEALRLGGVFVSFLPTVLQLHRLSQELGRDRHFELAESFEVLHRSWHLASNSARPDHRMVGHTGFITTAVRCSPRHDRAPVPEDETVEEVASAASGN